MQTTIVAIATPPGNSGVGIVRLSGPDALAVADKMLQNSKRLTDRKAAIVQVCGDTALVLYFKAPHSFTGEDVVEFQCHGSQVLLNIVVEAAISCGAVAATRGEFSRRAFLNGKLSLDQAEAIIEIINAESETHLKYASTVFGGALKNQLAEFENSLIEISAQIEATLDYPEEVETPKIQAPINNLIERIKSLTSTAATGRIIANGINVAVLGRPNAGKSSIFNALLSSDRSIVTEIPGTTTDTVTDAIIYNGTKMIFHDTAGLREGKNEIERLGIERSKKSIDNCDIALVIFDATDIEVPELLDLVKNKPHLVVYNKCDLVKCEAKYLNVSAKTGEGIQAIKQKIYELAISTPPASDQIIITNARHAAELTLAQTALENAMASIQNQMPLDCIAADIQTALAHIGNITGSHASEAVLDEIFSRFCLGK